MTSYELLTLIISILALVVSIFTAYKTFVSKFKPEIFIKPRIILTRIEQPANQNQLPAIVIGCELSNNSNKSGLIEDLILIIKFKPLNLNSRPYYFFPILVKNDFSIFKRYQETDFDPFQSISISAKDRVMKYIIFAPEPGTFAPSPGKGELKLFFRTFNNKKWQKFQNAQVTLEIDGANSETWSNPDGKSLMIETEENFRNRDEFLDTGLVGN